MFCCSHQASTARHLHTSLVQQLAILLLCDQSLIVREEDISEFYINLFCIQLAQKMTESKAHACGKDRHQVARIFNK